MIFPDAILWLLDGVCLLFGHVGARSSFPRPLTAEEEAVQVARAAEGDPHNLFHFIFGSPEEFAGSVDDTRDLLEQCAKTAEQLPRLYLSCGTADSLFPANKAFAERAKELGYSVKFHIEKEMGHSWRFWDLEVEKLLRTLL